MARGLVLFLSAIIAAYLLPASVWAFITQSWHPFLISEWEEGARLIFGPLWGVIAYTGLAALLIRCLP